MELNNDEKVQKLLEEISKKTEKLVNKVILRTALNNGISVIEVAEKYKDKIQDYRVRTRAKVISEYQKEINNMGIKEIVTPKPKTKEQKINFIKEKMFKEHLGYKEIASILGRDEAKVKRTVIRIMCKSMV